MSSAVPYARALSLLHARRETRWELGLGRARELARRLGHPERAYPAIHVAGTNGKGSFCALLEAVLRESGLRTGLTVSPHLAEPVERIRVAGAPISRAAFARALEAARGAETQPATYFELVTAAAFLHFERARVDAAVVEVGLGGRLDATNILPAPVLSVITSIGLDHREHLGPTLGHIAREKAGILKRGVPCLLGDMPEEALSAIREEAARTGATLHGPRQALARAGVDWEKGFQEVEGYGARRRLGLLGDAALSNAALVLEAVALLRERGWELPEEAVSRAFAGVHWPGRFQILSVREGSRSRTLVVDGAHNPPALEAFARTWRSSPFADRPATFLVGFLADKDFESSLRLLAPLGRDFIVARPNSPRALDPRRAARLLRALGVASVTASVTPRAALGLWRRSGSELGAVCGSFYLAGAVLSELGALS